MFYFLKARIFIREAIPVPEPAPETLFNSQKGHWVKCKCRWQKGIFQTKQEGKRKKDCHQRKGINLMTYKIGINKDLVNAVKDQAEKWDNHSNPIFHWMPSIIAAAGVLIFRDLSAVMGTGFALVAAFCGWRSKNSLNKIISLVVAGVLTVLYIYLISVY